jgi:hypothetical protein
MYTAYRRIFWGLLITAFHINLGNFQVIPAFVGWMVITGAVNRLYQEQPYDVFRKAGRCSLTIAGLSFLGFFFQITGYQNDYLYYLSVVIQIVNFLFAYYLLTGGGKCLSEDYRINEADGMELQLRFYMIIFIMNTVVFCIAIAAVNQEWLSICGGIAVLQIIWLMWMVSRLKSCYNIEPGQKQQEENNNV